MGRPSKGTSKDRRLKSNKRSKVKAKKKTVRKKRKSTLFHDPKKVMTRSTSKFGAY